MHTAEQLNASLEGRYVVDRLIGEGGMATVYLARDVRHNRKVALKVLKPDLGAVVGPERFLSEIQVTANLQHPNLLPLFDSGAADSLLFYVMPYVDGESLRVRLEREKQLPIDEAVRLATAIANALDYAHRHGVIHRDLKPENVLLHEGQPLVADFGIALAVSNAGGNRITQTGLSLGTPQYMSPEQATGDRVIDARTDIYSLGALTYEMLTGEPPHTGNTSQAVIARVLTERPRGIRMSRPNVPEQVEAAVERALEKLPADRWATAREFCEALSGARIVTRSTSTAIAADRAAARRVRPREIAGWTVGAAALAGLAFVSLRPEPAPAPVVPVEFEIRLPDSVEAIPRGSAALVALSPDGSTLVFQGVRGGDVALYTRRLDERDVQRIRGTDSSRAPTFSPDGSELLFVHGAIGPGAALKRVSIRGGSARTVFDSAGSVSWGETGQLVLATGGSIWIAPAEGGVRKLLAKPDSSRRHTGYGFPDILPGGRAALISIRKGAGLLDSTFLGIVSIPEGTVTELGIRGTFSRYSGTGHLLYATADGWLFAAPFDANKGRVSGPAAPIVEGVRIGTGGAASFAVARNGTLAYSPGDAGPGDRTLVAVSRAGVVRSIGARPGFYASPRVSPDGRQIALAVPTAAGQQFLRPDIWRFDTASKAMIRVTTDSTSLRPQWTRDGERIAYARRPVDTVIMSRPLYAAGQAVALFRAKTVISDFALGDPHGYAAIRIDTGTNRSDDIWLVHMDSLESPRPFLAEPYDEISPTISPDGSRLAYMTNRTGRWEVYVRPIVGGGAEVQVSVDGAAEPVWARTGQELFYRAPEHVMSAQLADGPRVAVARRDTLFRDSFGRYGLQSSNYDVMPDGQEFVMLQRGVTTVENSPIIILMNWHLRASAAPRDR